MGVVKRLADLHAMDDAVWMRHANPWSGWTRIPVLPLLSLAIWARVWIGWWCLLPIALLLLWTWLNPRAFTPPKSTDNWMSMAVLGERVWLNAAEVPIPHHHVVAANILNSLALLGLPPLVWGLWQLDLWAVLLGLALTIGPKLWFLDRMVWLYRDMAPERPEYAAWRY